jgi:dienelactone hydrolase
MGRFGGTLLVALAFGADVSDSASAAQVWLKDGRVIEGRVGPPIASVGAIPKAGGGLDGPVQLIVFVDDNLRRIFFSKRQIEQVLPEDSTQIFERFRIRQQVARQGRTVKTVGPIREIEPFDEFGRRTIEMNTNRGPVSVIQCITEITPLWTKAEGHLHVWDMRMATSNIRPDLLARILEKQIDIGSVDDREKVARFYLQAQRYEQANDVLEGVLRDFPNDDKLQERLQPLANQIKQLAARRLLDELVLRRAAGQHGLVAARLAEFPAEGVAGLILERVREMARDNANLEAQRIESLERFDDLLTKIADSAVRQRIEPIRKEIHAELSWNTVGRLSAFRRLASDESMKPEQRLALGISGWLIGGDAAVENLTVALSLYEVRKLILEYFRAEDVPARARVLERFRSEEGGAPAYVAGLLASMKPPLAPGSERPAEAETYVPDATWQDDAAPGAGQAADSPGEPPDAVPPKPGFFEFEVAGLRDAPPVRYVVQLPPEYDPYRLYPTILTLHGAATTPEQQIDWWAGPWAPGGWRAGQAARHGYLVVAPQWAAEHQTEYRYSAREHAAVLDSLRDACRRFAVDVDRVFLTGHSMGGDAAWDMGLAHPDLWAGVIPIVARSDRYCALYWENAELVPFYFVCGELDGGKMSFNARDFDRYLRRGFNCTVVEYQGRGHEHFSDEILRLFDWMGRFKRTFYPREFAASSMRRWDNFFWWVELDDMPARAMVDPIAWPPPRGTQAVRTEAKLTPNDRIYVSTGAGTVRIWLSPKMLSFESRPVITVNGNRLNTRAGDDGRDPFEDLDLLRETILEDVRTRGDRQQPFWVKIESSTGRALAR